MATPRFSLVRRLAVAVALTLASVAGPAMANEQPFDAWLAELRQEALGRGIAPATLDAAFVGIEPIPRVIELDRRQPEGTMTFAEYRTRVVSPQRIETGRQKLAEHAMLLKEVERRYGVPARFIVALWGVETGYGRNMGTYPVVGALATLAYDGRRAAFFRSELLNALRILQEGHIAPAAMRGSWAGAMGQSQFMPSSFLRFAVDYDGDGRRDIWGTQGDVFASIANYLASSGWVSGLVWGRPVLVPAGFDREASGADNRRPLGDWTRRGVRQIDGKPLPAADVQAGIVLPERDAQAPAFVVYENFRVLLRWNRSNYFALAVSELADRIAAP
ncbi:MAG: lytic murein transglycosylase [Alphaproteobacteria bacterium]|nr:lytic murein transglycosylase [Alphaproteobacteria bacterium]